MPFVFRLLYGEKKWGKYGALLLLPNEVLFDSFKFLNRRQLTNLESVCPRFHRIISSHIGEAPFLRLDFGFGFNDRFCFFLQQISLKAVWWKVKKRLGSQECIKMDKISKTFCLRSASINLTNKRNCLQFINCKNLSFFRALFVPNSKLGEPTQFKIHF